MTSSAYRWVTSTFIFLLLFTLGGAGVAHAQIKDFDVPAQSATTGIPQFGRQAGIQILVAEKLVHGKRTAAVKGSLSIEKALAMLLEGTGLIELSNDGHTLTLGNPPMPKPAEESTHSAPINLQDVGVEEIVVTALKRSTGLQTTPLSITALSGSTLDAIGATALADYVREVPNLVLTQGNVGQNRISIRGIQSSGEATVGLYYDETPITGPSGTNGDPGGNVGDINLYDVERVEVLRGPQGTLYGAGSMGGTVRVLFNKPNASTYQASFETQAETTDGGSAGYYGKGMVNVPLVRDNLALRVVAYDETRPGWVDNVRFGYENVNKTRSSGVRTLLAFTPIDGMTITGTYIYQTQRIPDTEPWYQNLGSSNGNAPALLPYANSLQLYNLTAKWQMPFATLTATSSRYRYDILRTIDFSPTVAFLAALPPICQSFYAQAMPCSATQASQLRTYTATRLPAIAWQPGVLESANTEVRLSSDRIEWFSWTIGGYYEDRHDSIVSNIAAANPINGGTPTPLDDTSDRYVQTGVRQTSEFGELTFTATHALSLTAGLRHFSYDKTTQGAVILGSALTGTVAGPFSSATARSDGLIPKVNLSYKIDTDIFAYATASKGFRPGGANDIPGLPAKLVAYQPDQLWNYEVGLKTAWLDGRLVVDADVYYIHWENMQAQGTTPNGLYAFITNAGSAAVKGGELEITARPIPSLTLSGSVGVADARLTSNQLNGDILPSGSTGLTGDRIPFVPDVTASASIAYQRPITDDIDGLARLDYSYLGDMTSQFRPDYVYFEEFGRFSTLNARVGATIRGWRLSAFVQNLTDAIGIDNKTRSLGTGAQSFGIMPRTVGVNLQKSF
jgi:iron complex outermembrane recepter protein